MTLVGNKLIIVSGGGLAPLHVMASVGTVMTEFVVCIYTFFANMD